MTTAARQPASAAAAGLDPEKAGRARLVGVDATRGVALLGMMAVHSLYLSDAAGRPTWTAQIFAGRAAAAFAVLAGAGVAFLTGRRRVPFSLGRPTAATLGVRALLIGAIGLALGHVDADVTDVILPYYAVMFVLALPLVFLPTRAVAVLGVTVAAGMPVLGQMLRVHLPDPSQANPTFEALVDHPTSWLADLSLTGIYPALPWMAYLCVGLVVGRLDLTKRTVAAILLAAGAVLAAATAVTSSMLLHRYGGLVHILAAQPGSGLTMDETSELLTFGGDGTTPTSSWWWLAVGAPHTSTPFDLLGTIGTALALLGVMSLAGSLTRPALRWFVAVVQVPLAAAGSMTLTFYVAHLLFINSGLDAYDATTGYLIQVVAVLSIGLACRATVGRGPLEAVVGALTARVRRRAARVRRRAARPRRRAARPRRRAAHAAGTHRSSAPVNTSIASETADGAGVVSDTSGGWSV